jgi:hypothetical protein
VIVELRHGDMREQPGAGTAAGDGVVGRGSLHHGLAGSAGEGLAHVPHHLEAARHVIEALRHVLADPAQATAAGRAGAGAGMSDGLARQMIGQGAAPRPSACRLDRLGDDRSRREALGLVDLQGLDGEFELLDAGLQLLGRDAELRPLQPGEFAAELLDQRVGMNGVPRHADDHAFERIHVIRQRGMIDSHANSLACP